MDDSKRGFTPITLVEEDLFETGESTDGESEDLDELIFKAENSQHLWLNSDSDEHLISVELLQEKLRQKDEGLHLTAKIGKKLLINSNVLTNQNQELKAQVLDLREELSQLKYLQSSKAKSLHYFEGSDEEDEGTCCRNHSLSPLSNASNNNSHLSLSVVSIEESFSLKRQIEMLQQNNLSLRDELKTLQHDALEEMDQLKEHYNSEFLNTKKMMGNLEKKIEVGENRFSKFERETKVWKESVEALAAKCNLHECEIDELQGEISKIKLDQKDEKNAMQQLVKENEELKELISDLKGRVHQMEQNSQPKVLRHVTDSSSPYVDSKSFTQELEQEQIDFSKENRIVRSISNSKTSALPGIVNQLVYHPERFLAMMKDLFKKNSALKLGQPGRLGSSDLELAVTASPLFLLKDPKPSIPWLGSQIQLLETFFERHCSQVKDHYHLQQNKIQLTDLSSSKAMALQHSKFLKNWCNLGTPDITTIFRKQSGVWIKGATVGEVFIEENFASIGLEAEEDECSSNSLKSSAGVPVDVQPDITQHFLPKSDLQDNIKAFINTHKSLEDIAKCTFDGVLSPLKSISLNDMSIRLHHRPSLGLGCLWKSADGDLDECSTLKLDDDLISSLKIVRSSST